MLKFETRKSMPNDDDYYLLIPEYCNSKNVVQYSCTWFSLRKGNNPLRLRFYLVYSWLNLEPIKQKTSGT